jgi:hypothetical protein
MKRDLHIDGITVEAVANAFTPILYRQIFHKDFMTEIQGFAKLKGKKTEEYTDEDTALALDRTQAFSRIAFVMKEQATGKTIKELVKLSDIDFFEWLATFEPMAFESVTTITDILSLWRGNAEDNQVQAKNA